MNRSPPDNPNEMFAGDLNPGRFHPLDWSRKFLGPLGRVGQQPGDTGAVHGIACPAEHLLCTAGFVNGRVQLHLGSGS